jgi:hypothetical protein
MAARISSNGQYEQEVAPQTRSKEQTAKPRVHSTHSVQLTPVLHLALLFCCVHLQEMRHSWQGRQ